MTTADQVLAGAQALIQAGYRFRLDLWDADNSCVIAFSYADQAIVDENEDGDDTWAKVLARVVIEAVQHSSTSEGET